KPPFRAAVLVGFTRSQTDCDDHVCQGSHWASSWACHSCPILLHSLIKESVEPSLHGIRSAYKLKRLHHGTFHFSMIGFSSSGGDSSRYGSKSRLARLEKRRMPTARSVFLPTHDNCRRHEQNIETM